MTLVLSLIHPEAIIMGADSRKTEEITPVDFHTFEPTGQTQFILSETNKLYAIQGIGCISMWGDITRAEKKLGAYLRSIGPQLTGPEDLADKLLIFLSNEIHAEDGEAVGFHVGGYKADGSRVLFHVFWGPDIGPKVDPNNNPPKYAKYDHSKEGTALYNGKHSIADVVIRFLLALQAEVGILTWITSYEPERAARFVEFVIRYAARADITVGGDAKVALVLPKNMISITQKSTSLPMPFIDAVLTPQNDLHRPTGTVDKNGYEGEL